ncbi:unnamed protein product [Protopolystoma xenopodis]|uniref:Uncharacterized protein n=1 Tax=Protopolystoma xenopodis TaxID=117903 RepID=A0A448XDK9_9PLAT|nr:unnamed protein product [Protopolystoma xenopodis]
MVYRPGGLLQWYRATIVSTHPSDNTSAGQKRGRCQVKSSHDPSKALLRLTSLSGEAGKRMRPRPACKMGRLG